MRFVLSNYRKISDPHIQLSRKHVTELHLEHKGLFFAVTSFSCLLSKDLLEQPKFSEKINDPPLL